MSQSVILTIALNEGFFDEEVSLRIQGGEIFHETGVTTRMQTGLARRIQHEVAPGQVQLEIELPRRAVRLERTLAVAAPVYVGINVDSTGEISVQEQSEDFRYM